MEITKTNSVTITIAKKYDQLTATATCAISEGACQSITDGNITDADSRLLADFNAWSPAGGELTVSFHCPDTDRPALTEAINDFLESVLTAALTIKTTTAI